MMVYTSGSLASVFLGEACLNLFQAMWD
uniref:Uncharacterized protein n=1 Tax=Arundo donax TaxID=35708 RepID=A0A0A9C991_ARUDO